MFLPVDSLRQLTLTIVLALLSPPAKTKRRLDDRLHSDAQVSIRAKKHQVYRVVSVLEISYLAKVLGTLYIG